MLLLLVLSIPPEYIYCQKITFDTLVHLMLGYFWMEKKIVSA